MTPVPQNKPLLDKVDYGDTLSTCRVINFYSSSSRSTHVSIISDLTINSWWIILLPLSILTKNKDLNREEDITGLLDVNVTKGYLLEVDASR